MEWQESLIINPQLPKGSKLFQAEVDGGRIEAGFVNTKHKDGPRSMELAFFHKEQDKARLPTTAEIYEAAKLFFPEGTVLTTSYIVGWEPEFQDEEEEFGCAIALYEMAKVNPLALQ